MAFYRQTNIMQESGCYNGVLVHYEFCIHGKGNIAKVFRYAKDFYVLSMQ